MRSGWRSCRIGWDVENNVSKCPFSEIYTLLTLRSSRCNPACNLGDHNPSYAMQNTHRD